MRIRTLTTAYMGSNCYLLIEDGSAVVIDPADADLICGVTAEEALELDFGILTHEHCDHTAACSQMRREFHCEMTASRICGENVRDSRKNFSRYYNAFTEVQGRLSCEGQRTMEPFTSNVDRVFDGEMTLDWKGHTLYLRETPGHSPGSICILLDHQILFSGDTLMKDDATGVRFSGGNREQLLNNTVPWLRSLPEDLTVYPGHGDKFRLGDRLAEPIL